MHDCSKRGLSGGLPELLSPSLSNTYIALIRELLQLPQNLPVARSLLDLRVLDAIVAWHRVRVVATHTLHGRLRLRLWVDRAGRGRPLHVSLDELERLHRLVQLHDRIVASTARW